MERYPVFNSGQLVGYVRTFSDFVEYTHGDVAKIFLWSNDSGSLYAGNGPFYNAVYEPPTNESLAKRFESVDERINYILAKYGKKIEGKHIMADLSGGKDSTANLILLTKLREKLGFKLTAVYIHMPLLEPTENYSFVEKIASKLDVPLETATPDKNKLLYYLATQGLPKRGDRWCTYLKTRSLREVKKKIKAEIEAKAERALEAGKRYERLSSLANKGIYLNGGVINLVHDLTITEIADLLKKEGLVHPHYLQGLPRVSCRFCPYRGLYELKLSEKHEVEDEGTIDSILARTYREYYSQVSTLEEFLTYHLWRFTPSVAKLRLQEEKATLHSEKLSLDQAREMFSSLWVASRG